MTADYANARCCAIKRDGKRCTGRWASAQPVLFAWDPIKGVGIDGPNVVLCWRHRDMRQRRRPERIRVFRGWLGGANKYDYGACVFRAKTGWKPAAWWWARRSDSCFGKNHRRDAP